MSSHFICEHKNPVRPGESFTLDQCRVCWLKVGGKPGGKGPFPPAAPVRPVCLHLGMRVVPPLAPDGFRVWHRCERGHGVVCPCGACKSCVDYEADGPAGYGPVGRRHLVFHLLPMSGNGSWRRAVDHLRLRWDLFTGVKVIAVASGPGGGFPLDVPGEVRDYVPPDCQILEVPNDPSLREVASWVPLWERVLAAASDDDAVFYAHGKGVTRQVDPGNSCQWWASLLYTLHLDHWPLVEAELANHPIAGAFKKVGHGFRGSPSAWHFSGSFFWARAGDIRERPWRSVERVWFGTESWPGTAYHPDESGCLFLPGIVPTLDLYSPAFWDAVVRPRYAEWLRQNPPAFPWLLAS